MTADDPRLRLPWRWQDFGGHSTLVTDGAGAKVVLAAIRDRHGNPLIATRYAATGWLNPIELDDPVARRIGALPDLIRALQALAAIRPANWNDGDDPEQQAAWELADAALAAAGAPL